MGGREVGGERRSCRHRRRRRGGRLRATPPCAQRSVSPAEAARPQQPRKSVALAPSLRALAPRLGLCVAASAGAAPRGGGGTMDGACGGPGRPRPGPARTMQGEGCRKGVCAGRWGLSAFRLPALPRAEASRPCPPPLTPRLSGWRPGCLSVRPPGRGFGKRGEAGRVQRSACVGSGRRGRSGCARRCGQPRGPEQSWRRTGVGTRETATWVRSGGCRLVKNVVFLLWEPIRRLTGMQMKAKEKIGGFRPRSRSFPSAWATLRGTQIVAGFMPKHVCKS